MSCRRSGNVRTSKSWTVSQSSGMPSSAVASRTSRASVSGSKPGGKRTRRDREGDVANLAAALDEPRHRAAAAELAVVRVRREHERPLPGLDHRAIQPANALTSFGRGAASSRDRRARRRARRGRSRCVPRGRRSARSSGSGCSGSRRLVSRWSLVGDDDLELLLHEPTGIALVGVGALAALASPSCSSATPPWCRSRFSRPRRSASRSRSVSEEAFLLLPLYLVLAAAVLALAYRIASGRAATPPPVPARAPAGGVRDALRDVVPLDLGRARRGIALAFFVFPFVAGLGVRRASARRGVAASRARWSRWSRSGRSSRPSGSGRRTRGRSSSRRDWRWRTRTRPSSGSRRSSRIRASTAATSWCRSPCSSSRSSSAAGGRSSGSRRPLRRLSLLAASSTRTRSRASSRCSSSRSVSRSSERAAAPHRSASPARSPRRSAPPVSRRTAIDGRSARDVTSGRSRLVDDHPRRVQGASGRGSRDRRPAAASAEDVRKGSPRRNASHTTPLTVLAELGVVGFAALCAGCSWRLRGRSCS